MKQQCSETENKSNSISNVQNEAVGRQNWFEIVFAAERKSSPELVVATPILGTLSKKCHSYFFNLKVVVPLIVILF